ncbi:MAG: hypothetical protein IKE58_10850 [Blautia sp.]|nr:hypothetical protein [Blautia sp.]
MKKKKTGQGNKGEYGYFKKERKKRLGITFILFAVPLFIFFSSWIYFHSRNTVWTVVALVGCLPACKSLVGLIMIWPRRSLDEARVMQWKAHQGRLTMAFEMYMTFYEKSAYLDAFAVCGNQVVAYSSDPSIDTGYMVSHMEQILKENGYHHKVMILTKENAFIDRLDSLNANFDALRQGAAERKDDRYPGFSRDEIVRELLLRLCL